MRYIIHAIREQDVTYSVEADSIDEAIDIYPERGEELAAETTNEYFDSATEAIVTIIEE